MAKRTQTSDEGFVIRGEEAWLPEEWAKYRDQNRRAYARLKARMESDPVYAAYREGYTKAYYREYKQRPEVKARAREYTRRRRAENPELLARERARARIYWRLRSRNEKLVASLHELACTGPPCSCPLILITAPR